MLGRVFKAYDIRGTYPDLLNEQMAWQIGFGASKYLRGGHGSAVDRTPMMRNIVVGRDMRKSSPSLARQLIDGIVDEGCDVIDVGMVDTPFVTFAINYLDCAGGIMTTASHNPPQYNGFKISKQKAKPVGEQTGLADIRKHAAMADRATARNGHRGRVQVRDLWEPYKQHVLSFLDLQKTKIKVVVDASNSMAGTMIPKIFGKGGEGVPGLTIVELNFDNTSGVFVHEPNPLVPANLRQLQDAVVAEGADMGICFDGDADRCMLVDERGRIVGCDHLTAVIARHFLDMRKGGSIVYDLRSSKAVEEEIAKAGGKPVRSRVGHVFMKEALREQDAVFGGELSGHFYFKDSFYADSGAVAMAVALSVFAAQRRPVSDVVKPIARYAQSGEINFEIEDKDAALEQIRDEYADKGTIDELDGVTVDCFKGEGWWANIRKSNTEPLLRLNAEARTNLQLEKIVSELSPVLGRRVDH